MAIPPSSIERHVRDALMIVGEGTNESNET
jgi:hypothetical protein